VTPGKHIMDTVTEDTALSNYAQRVTLRRTNEPAWCETHNMYMSMCRKVTRCLLVDAVNQAGA